MFIDIVEIFCVILVVLKLEFCNLNLIRNSKYELLVKKNGISMRMCIFIMLVILFRMNNVV